MPPFKISKSSDATAPSTEEPTLRLAKARVEEWREQGASPMITDLATGQVLTDQDLDETPKPA